VAGIFDGLMAEIAGIEPVRPIGRVTESGRGSFTVSGLPQAALGDRVLVETGAGALGGEVLRLSAKGATVLPEDDPEGLMIGARVALLGPATIAPDRSWLGRIVDPTGQPLDGRPLMRGPAWRTLTGAPPAPAERRAMGERLSTGTAAFDTLLPLVRGQRIGLFAGSGVGKSSLLARFRAGWRTRTRAARFHRTGAGSGGHGAVGCGHGNLGSIAADAAALRPFGDGSGRAFPRPRAACAAAA